MGGTAHLCFRARDGGSGLLFPFSTTIAWSFFHSLSAEVHGHVSLQQRNDFYLLNINIYRLAEPGEKPNHEREGGGEGRSVSQVRNVVLVGAMQLVSYWCVNENNITPSSPLHTILYGLKRKTPKNVLLCLQHPHQIGERHVGALQCKVHPGQAAAGAQL